MNKLANLPSSYLPLPPGDHNNKKSEISYFKSSSSNSGIVGIFNKCETFYNILNTYETIKNNFGASKNLYDEFIIAINKIVVKNPEYLVKFYEKIDIKNSNKVDEIFIKMLDIMKNNNKSHEIEFKQFIVNSKQKAINNIYGYFKDKINNVITSRDLSMVVKELQASYLTKLQDGSYYNGLNLLIQEKILFLNIKAMKLDILSTTTFKDLKDISKHIADAIKNNPLLSKNAERIRNTINKLIEEKYESIIFDTWENRINAIDVNGLELSYIKDSVKELLNDFEAVKHTMSVETRDLIKQLINNKVKEYKMKSKQVEIPNSTKALNKDNSFSVFNNNLQPRHATVVSKNRGLTNFGNTCYVASAMQALFRVTSQEEQNQLKNKDSNIAIIFNYLSGDNRINEQHIKIALQGLQITYGEGEGNISDAAEFLMWIYIKLGEEFNYIIDKFTNVDILGEQNELSSQMEKRRNIFNNPQLYKDQLIKENKELEGKITTNPTSSDTTIRKQTIESNKLKLFKTDKQIQSEMRDEYDKLKNKLQQLRALNIYDLGDKNAIFYNGSHYITVIQEGGKLVVLDDSQAKTMNKDEFKKHYSNFTIRAYF